VLLALQGLFYLLALWGWAQRNRPAPFPGFFIPFYFCMMNASVFFGLARLLRRRQSAVWEKAQRTPQKHTP
ncbi:MAG: glycosyltransferase family 2 protein, partial [Bacteroidetes bacterium]